MKREHIGWSLSRKCIQDTLMAKRSRPSRGEKIGRYVGLLTKLYGRNIQALRETQLAPYTETLVAGRYREKMLRKRYAPEIVVVISEGLVRQVYASNPYTRVMCVDKDCLQDPNVLDWELVTAHKALDRAAMPDMKEVF